MSAEEIAELKRRLEEERRNHARAIRHAQQLNQESQEIADAVHAAMGALGLDPWNMSVSKRVRALLSVACPAGAAGAMGVALSPEGLRIALDARAARPDGLYYLASPYSAPAAGVREGRWRSACAVVAQLSRVGLAVYSPIVHGHHLAVCHGVLGDWDWWAEIDRIFLARCDELWVLALPGWEASRGVNAERCIARELGRPERLLPVVGEWAASQWRAAEHVADGHGKGAGHGAG